MHRHAQLPDRVLSLREIIFYRENQANSMKRSREMRFLIILKSVSSSIPLGGGSACTFSVFPQEVVLDLQSFFEILCYFDTLRYFCLVLALCGPSLTLLLVKTDHLESISLHFKLLYVPYYMLGCNSEYLLTLVLISAICPSHFHTLEEGNWSSLTCARSYAKHSLRISAEEAAG